MLSVSYLHSTVGSGESVETLGKGSYTALCDSLKKIFEKNGNK